MIPLAVVMLDVFGNRSTEMTVAERDHAIETVVLDRSHEPFGVGIRVGRPIRCLHDADSGLT
jgi:hypothetical protein